jgi:hypothetical protein
MKRRPSIFAVAVALLAPLAMVLSMAAATPALADGYQYTVRVFPGNRGKLSADPVSTTVPKGGSVNLYDLATAKITDSKYVQTGFRLSGADKLLGNGQINGISEDMDFVVAYGVEANTVSYTLRFVEYETGRQLAEPRTYYGKVGDKPVAAYEYVEGYRPRYLSITGTLKADEDNVWTFEYIALPEGETGVTSTTTTGTTYWTTPIAAGSSDAGASDDVADNAQAGDDSPEGEEASSDEDAEGADEADTGTGDTAGQGEEPVTQEILDLDTPLAGPDSLPKAIIGEALMLTTPVIVSGVVLIGGSAIAIAYFLVKRRKVKANEEKA